MTRYSNYNNSETKWIGSIPDNWGISRLDREAYIRARLGWRGLKADEYVSSGYGFLATPNIKGRDIDFTNINFISAERYFESPEIILDVGDVLLTKDGSTIGTTYIVRHLPFPCTVNGSIAVLTPTNGILPLYLYYYLTSPKAQDRFWYLQDGQGVPHLFQRDLRKIEIIKPPLEEQLAIVRHLENKTAEIDGLIEKLRCEVELLEQYRRELIARTVTRGLDPDTPMRDSGIEWIGEIPEAWALLRISALYDIRSQKVNDTDYQPLSVTMNGVVAQLEHVAKTNDGDNRKLVRAGDFVINSRSDRRGACGIAPQDGSCSLINIVLSPQQSIHNPYFSYLFRSSLFSDEFYRWGHGIHDDLWTTNWADMKSIQVPVPPLNHQVLIADYLDKKMSEINSTITGINNQIELLGKYRKQVINDAVTGKICVEKVA